MRKRRTEEEWRKIIDGTKTARDIAIDCNVSIGNVYYVAERYGLKLIEPCLLKKEYHGVPLKVLKDELEKLPISAVCLKYGLSSAALDSFLTKRGIKFFKVKQRYINKEPTVPKSLRRTGMAHDMIRTLLPYYTDASIGRVFGYSKEMIRQIRKESENAEK